MFLNKSSLDFFKPVVNFQNSEKVDLRIFASILTAFMEQIFKGPFSTNLMFCV